MKLTILKLKKFFETYLIARYTVTFTSSILCKGFNFCIKYAYVTDNTYNSKFIPMQKRNNHNNINRLILSFSNNEFLITNIRLKTISDLETSLYSLITSNVAEEMIIYRWWNYDFKTKRPKHLLKELGNFFLFKIFLMRVYSYYVWKLSARCYILFKKC